jgi:pimeloyl-ACP methyl ester carboxylesterase
MTERNKPTGASESDEPTTSRRRLLKGIGATAAAGTGLTALSGSAAAQSVELIQVDESFFGGFDANADLPVVEELFVFVHGWFGDTTVESQATDVLNSVEAGGYVPDAAVAIEWPASNFFYSSAESDTEGVGAEVADLVETFKDSGGGQVRLTGHSLGGRVVYWAANKIQGETIDTIGALGTAADGSQVCPGGEWYDGVRDNAGPVRNYYSLDDDIVGGAYGGYGDTPLGTEGAPCDGAGNYTDADVTATVSGHLDYLGDAQVGADFASVI